MSKVLKSFEFPASQTASKYPWETWSDGKIRELKRGTDFTCAANTVVQRARAKAKSLGKKLRIKVTDEDTVVLQFIAAPEAEASE